MPTVVERVSVVEVQVLNLDEKIDDLKVEVHGLQQTVDLNHQAIHSQLQQMQTASSNQHAEMARSIASSNLELKTKISELENFKNKWSYMLIGATAVITWVISHTDIINKIFG